MWFMRVQIEAGGAIKAQMKMGYAFSGTVHEGESTKVLTALPSRTGREFRP